MSETEITEHFHKLLKQDLDKNVSDSITDNIQIRKAEAREKIAKYKYAIPAIETTKQVKSDNFHETVVDVILNLLSVGLFIFTAKIFHNFWTATISSLIPILIFLLRRYIN